MILQKTIPLIAFFIFAGFSLPIPFENSESVIKTATNNLNSMLAQIPKGMESRYGFTNRGELTKAGIGKPYHVITFTNDFYNTDKLTDNNYLQLTDEWRVPVTINGENRTLLTVTGKDSSFKVVDMGGTLLAKELNQKNIGNNTGDYFLLRVYPLAMDLIVIPGQGGTLKEASYIPLTSAIMAIKAFGEKNTFTLNEVLQLVKQQVPAQSKN